MSMKLIFYFIFITLISVFNSSGLNKNNDENIQINNSNQKDFSDKRKLEENDYKPIRIEFVYMAQIEFFGTRPNEKENIDLFKTAFDKVVSIVQKLVSVHRLTEKIAITSDINQDHLLDDYIGIQYEADLVIFVDGSKDLSDKDFAQLKIIKKYDRSGSFNFGRPIIGYLDFNLRHRSFYLPQSDDYIDKIYLYEIFHEFTHFLGFEKSILKSKSKLSTYYSKRVNGKNRNRLIAVGGKMLQTARNYFGYNLPGIEFDTNNTNLEGEEFLHWDKRLMLGDYMTSDIYYPDQAISEITLALLEDLQWYNIKYYTGGLMRFGKHKGKDFIDNDCVKDKDGKTISPSFLNEFCFQEGTEVYGTCSPGRQSRGYCLQKTNYVDVPEFFRRVFTSIEWTSNYGSKNIEYCPVTSETIIEEAYKYYTGNCKIGNSNYGDEIEPTKLSYSTMSADFGEKLGENSLCALSSIYDKNKNYIGALRPTCYIMICGERSLTVQIGDEFIVCPRGGGLIKIGRNTASQTQYTKYYGYFYCPDYNMICTGTKFCNDMFDCIEKESEYKTPTYDYDLNNDELTSQVTSSIKSNDELNNIYVNEGYELTNNGTCPMNCNHCLSYKRCVQCGNNNQYYIGEKDDNASQINCTNTWPSEGYYNIPRYETKIHFFRCLENCYRCTNASVCQQCNREYYLGIRNIKCEVRIPHCKEYDIESLFADIDHNGGGLGYRYCKTCETNYYCVDDLRGNCTYIAENEFSRYYVTESGICYKDCNVTYPNCISCKIDECLKCDPRFKFSDINVCSERIPHCREYNLSTVFIDIDDNKGGEGYKECQKCEDHYYCIKENKGICEHIPDLTGYYDYGNDCKDACANEFTFVCVECVKERCQKCLTKHKTDNIHCVEGIQNCLAYDSESPLVNDTYIECAKCDRDKGYYCIGNIRTSCEKIVNISLYYPTVLDNDTFYSCYNRCDSDYPGCETCNREKCLTCKPRFIMDNNTNECLIDFDRMPDDYCKISTHPINLDLKEINFYDLVDYYFNFTFSYLNTIDFFVNDKYTLAMFINSGCTEGLLEQGYYKIDSNALTKAMTSEARVRVNEFLIHFFIIHNNQNYYRIHSIYTGYLKPEDHPSSLKVPYILTNKYNRSITSILGPILSSVVISEKKDIFSMDSDIYTNLCQNVTLQSIDIPLDERLHYIYLNDYSTRIACSGDNCELDEINTEEATSTCRCYINKFEDLFKEIEFKNYEVQGVSSGFSESFGIIKCAKNGFNKNNIKANGGFYMSIIAIVGEGVLYLCYFLCSSKAIIIANPPSKVKNRLKIRTDWEEVNNRNTKKKQDELICDFQDRDEREKDLYEEEKDYTCGTDSFFNEILYNEMFGKGAKLDSEKTKKKKYLVLLPGKRGEEEESMSDQSILLGKSKKKYKKSYCEIYWHVLSLKQHIINFFTVCNCCNITESYVPLPIRLIRSIFLIILAFLFNILFLNQKYYSQKFRYFNENYKLIAGTTDDLSISPDEIVFNEIPNNELWKYSLSHTFINALFVLALLIIVQFIIGVAFFSLRKYIFKRDDKSAFTELESKTKIKYFIFFIITIVLLIIFMFAFIGFGSAYGGGFGDYFIPGIVSLILLQIFPIIWSIIIAIFYYIGIRCRSKCCRKISRFFMF